MSPDLVKISEGNWKNFKGEEICPNISKCEFAGNEMIRGRFCYHECGVYCPEQFSDTVRFLVKRSIRGY